MSKRLPISVVVPTYGREQVLVDTLRQLEALADAAGEIIVVDQTPAHEPRTAAFLREAHASGRLQHVVLPQPSITAAMNTGLARATQPVVLFLDDDIVPFPDLIAAHAAAHAAHPGVLVAGRVLQPWDDPSGQPAARGPNFSSREPGWVQEFIGCNFSVPREDALAVGGFDENFVRVAYRYEAEFAHRWMASGGRIFFSPQAGLRHLKVTSGGTRSFGEHLTTWRPDHAVGAYYWALRTGRWREFLLRPARSIRTRFHLRHPWRIPATLAAEVSGMTWALRLNARGPKHLRAHAPKPP